MKSYLMVVNSSKWNDENPRKYGKDDEDEEEETYCWKIVQDFCVKVLSAAWISVLLTMKEKKSLYKLSMKEKCMHRTIKIYIQTWQRMKNQPNENVKETKTIFP